MTEPRSDAPRAGDVADELFASWLDLQERGDATDFEAFCAGHSAHAGDLRRLHDDWTKLRETLAASANASLSDRIRALFGDGVDPGIILDDEAPGDATASVLEALKSRGPAASRYGVKDKLGRGAMGAVYRVFDRDLRRHLAMKVILDVEPVRLSRFLEEAQVTGQLDHPGIVPIHELGIDRDGRVFFTMKLVRGETLEAVFDKVAKGTDGWSVTRAAGVIQRVCEAMAFAHDKGVIHRDLKPANVMIGRHGEMYVMDWGLARVLGRPDTRDVRIRTTAADSIVQTVRRDRGGSSAAAAGSTDSPLITMDGDVVGTPSYMPPEQAEGDVESMGPHSDVYAVGAMLYRLITSRMPWDPLESTCRHASLSIL